MPTGKRKKRYLTGIDWVVNALDDMSRNAGGRGNSSQVVLEAREPISAPALRDALDRAAAALPLIGGRVGRALNLCPCWKYDVGMRPEIPLTVRHVDANDAAAADGFFLRHVNTPFASRRRHIRFLLVNRSDGSSALAMHFDHRLLDAFGAESFLELLNAFGSGCESDVLERISVTGPPHLDRWGRRFLGGRNTNRMQLRLSRGGMASLPLRPSVKARDTLFEITRFSPAETARIKESLSSDPGPGFMFLLPSVLARVLGPLHGLMRERGCRCDNYVIPVSVVRRAPDEVWEKLFFNHLSFLFFKTSASDVESGTGLVRNLQEQLFESIRSGVPEDIYHASMLTRIAPLPMMRLIARIPVKGRVATCCFACLKESGFRSERFLGAEIENLVHTPHVPAPPGLGISLNFFSDRMNLVLSHIDGLLRDGEAGRLTTGMKEALLGDDNL